MPHRQHLIGHVSDFALIILAGAFVHVAVQYRQSKAMQITFSVLDAFLSFGIAGFTGIMAILGSYVMGIENELALLWLGGAGAVMGLKFFNQMFDMVGDHILKMRSK